MEVDQRIVARGRYFAGQAGSAFYRTLQAEGTILASRCDRCDRVYWPPRTTCGRCFSILPESALVAVGPGGTLETFTRIAYTEPMHPRPAPFFYGIVKLDGADTGMAHIIDAEREADLFVGMRVTAVFETDRQGSIFDIRHFRPESTKGGLDP